MSPRKENINKKRNIIIFFVIGIIIAIVAAVGIYFAVVQYKEDKQEAAIFDTSVAAEVAAGENSFQYSDTVVEINSKIFTTDSAKITMRKTGTNEEKILAKGNFFPGIVTDGKTLYYYDMDKNAIMSLNVEKKKTKEIVKVLDHIEVDDKSLMEEFVFARFDGKCGDYLYYQMQQGEEYMPNYMVNLKTGKVKKLSLTDYGTYKFQIANDKLYFDIYRTISAPTVLYTADPDGSNIKTLVEGVSNFEIVGDKLYYFKVEDVTKSVNKIMCMDLTTGKSETLRDNMEYSTGGFTSFGMISDKSIGDGMYTVIDYYQGTSEALNGNGARICSDVAIIHLGVETDREAAQAALEEATTLEWFVVGNGKTSKEVSTPKGTTPVNFKDGYLYYYSYTEEGGSIMNRVKVEF